MASLEAGIVERAHARAQRRFRHMLTDQTYGDPTNRRTVLYVQAERLVDALLGEMAWTAVQAQLQRLRSADADEDAQPSCCGADESTPHWIYCQNHPTAHLTLAGTSWAPGIEQYQAESR